MEKVRVTKIIGHHRLFNRGQKVWIIVMTGSLAARVCGKYRGRGRYITAWVHHPKQVDFEKIKEIEVPDTFAEKIKCS